MCFAKYPENPDPETMETPDPDPPNDTPGALKQVVLTAVWRLRSSGPGPPGGKKNKRQPSASSAVPEFTLLDRKFDTPWHPMEP